MINRVVDLIIVRVARVIIDLVPREIQLCDRLRWEESEFEKMRLRLTWFVFTAVLIDRTPSVLMPFSLRPNVVSVCSEYCSRKVGTDLALPD